MPLLEARGLGKRFGAHAALSDVTLALAAGEVHALLGENGAGKSTLLAILCGALRPDDGALYWEGQPVSPGDVAGAQRLGISIVHQEPQLVPSLSVAENISLGRLPRGLGPVRWLDRVALREQAEAAVAAVGLEVDTEHKVAALGTAHRQLVAIARALHFGARLILLDEPTSSLSSTETEALFTVLRRLRDGGTALVYISHRLDEVRAIADRATVLRDGRVVAASSMAGLDDRTLIDAMSGRPARAHAPGAANPTTGGEIALEVRGLLRARRLHDVCLHVRTGEIVGLAGLVGAGRSRTLRSILHADPVDGGEVRLRAEDGTLRAVTDLPGAIEAGIGFVPEDRRHQGLVMTASVAENIALVTSAEGRRWGFLRWDRLRDTARRVVEMLRIKARGIDDPVRILSGGNQQKVVLGRWLSPRHRVLLLDEPTRGVDVGAKAEIHAHLRALAAEGRALLVASSEIPELQALCDRVYVMRQGRIAGELSRAQATAAEILRLATGTGILASP